MLASSARRTYSRTIPRTARRLASSAASGTPSQKAENRTSPGSSTKNTASSSTSASSEPIPDQPFPAPYVHKEPSLPPRSPISNWILKSEIRTNILMKMGDLMGYGSPKHVAGRRSKIIYEMCSAIAVGPEQAFWYDKLSLPRTFQSWFTITNLHVWMATVRLRALPPSHGRAFIQGLIDHFFLDVEDRLRAVLGKKAPERLVTRQMKILREQWHGLGLACDIALMTGDKDMASAVWRNLLGARGAHGIAYPEAPSTPSTPEDPTSEQKLDPATGGVTDFEGAEVDKYVLYPELMLITTAYTRRELVRLSHVSDTALLGGQGRGTRESIFGPQPGANVNMEEATKSLYEAVKFGSVKEAGRKLGVDIDSETFKRL